MEFLFWFGAGDEIRTRDIYLGKVVLYQLSYSRGRGIISQQMIHTTGHKEEVSPRKMIPHLNQNKLPASTYFCRGLPPNYHRR